MSTRAAGGDAGLELLWGSGPDEPAPVRRRRGRGARALWALVLVVALVAGGLAGVRHAGDADLREALSSSTRELDVALRELAAASSADKVAQAAGSARQAAGRIDATLLRLGPQQAPREVAVQRQLEAERALLQALAGLEALADAPLRTWGAAHAEITAAARAEGVTRSALRRHHEAAARRLPDTSLLLSRITAAVGPALVDGATGESTRLLKELRAAQRTADLRALGAAATAAQPAVAEAAAALPPGSGRQVLAGYAEALAALGDLAQVDADSAGGWPLTRAELARSFGEVAAAGSLAGGNVRVVLEGALVAVDGVLQAAASAMSAWRAEVAAATAAQEADTRLLKRYADGVRGELAEAERLQGQLSRFARGVGEPGSTTTATEAAEVLQRAAADRTALVGRVDALEQPDDLDLLHQELLDVLEQGLADVLAAGEALVAVDCPDGCPDWRQAPGWRTLLSASAGTASAYAAVVTRWEAEVAAAAARIPERALPPKPDV